MAYEVFFSSTEGVLKDSTITGTTGGQATGASFSPDGTRFAVITKRAGGAVANRPGIDIYTKSGTGPFASWGRTDHFVQDTSDGPIQQVEWLDDDTMFFTVLGNSIGALDGGFRKVVVGNDGSFQNSTETTEFDFGPADEDQHINFLFSKNKTRIVAWNRISSEFRILSLNNGTWSGQTLEPITPGGNVVDPVVGSATWVDEDTVIVSVPKYGAVDRIQNASNQAVFNHAQPTWSLHVYRFNDPNWSKDTNEVRTGTSGAPGGIHWDENSRCLLFLPGPMLRVEGQETSDDKPISTDPSRSTENSNGHGRRNLASIIPMSNKAAGYKLIDENATLLTSLVDDNIIVKAHGDPDGEYVIATTGSTGTGGLCGVGGNYIVPDPNNGISGTSRVYYVSLNEGDDPAAGTNGDGVSYSTAKLYCIEWHLAGSESSTTSAKKRFVITEVATGFGTDFVGFRPGVGLNGEVVINSGNIESDDLTMFFSDGKGPYGDETDFDDSHIVKTNIFNNSRQFQHITGSNNALNLPADSSDANTIQKKGAPWGGVVSPDGQIVAVQTSHRNNTTSETPDYGIDFYTSGETGWSLVNSIGAPEDSDGNQKAIDGCMKWLNNNELWFVARESDQNGAGIYKTVFDSETSTWSDSKPAVNARWGADPITSGGEEDWYWTDFSICPVKDFVFNKNKDLCFAITHIPREINTGDAQQRIQRTRGEAQIIIFYKNSTTDLFYFQTDGIDGSAVGSDAWDGLRFIYHDFTDDTLGAPIGQIEPGKRTTNPDTGEDIQEFFISIPYNDDSSGNGAIINAFIDLSQWPVPVNDIVTLEKDGTAGDKTWDVTSRFRVSYNGSGNFYHDISSNGNNAPIKTFIDAPGAGTLYTGLGPVSNINVNGGNIIGFNSQNLTNERSAAPVARQWQLHGDHVGHALGLIWYREDTDTLVVLTSGLDGNGSARGRPVDDKWNNWLDNNLAANTDNQPFYEAMNASFKTDAVTFSARMWEYSSGANGRFHSRTEILKSVPKINPTLSIRPSSDGDRFFYSNCRYGTFGPGLNPGTTNLGSRGHFDRTRPSKIYCLETGSSGWSITEVSSIQRPDAATAHISYANGVLVTNNYQDFYYDPNSTSDADQSTEELSTRSDAIFTIETFDSSGDGGGGGGVIVGPQDTLTLDQEIVTLSENAGSQDIVATLNFEPGDGETITVTPSNIDTTEFTISPSSVDYINQETTKTFTITPVQDFTADGDQTTTVTFTTSGHTDGSKNGLTDTVDIIITDTSQIADFTVTPGGPITLNEGNDVTFSVVLQAEPTNTVVIDYEIIDLDARASVSLDTNNQQKLTFNSTNWSVSQTVTLTIANDEIDESGNVSGQIKFSLGSETLAEEFNNANANNALDQTVDITINEDASDIAVVIVAGGPIHLTEGGDNKSLSISLNSEPTDDVTVNVVLTQEVQDAIVDNRLTVVPANLSLTFTDSNGLSPWNSAQQITFTAIDDSIAYPSIFNQPITFTATSNDSQYNGINISVTSLTLEDDDTAGVTINAVNFMTQNGMNLIDIEEGQTAEFTVELSSQPTDTVTVNLTENQALNSAIANNRITVTPAPDENGNISLTFEVNNDNGLIWNTPQTIQVEGIDDNEDNGDLAGMELSLSIAPGNDSVYNDLSPSLISDSIHISLTDNDTAGFTFNRLTNIIPDEEGHSFSGIIDISEGESATFSIQLDSEPSDTVTITLTPDVALIGSELQQARAIISPLSLVFEKDNTNGKIWSQAQTVTIEAIDNQIIGDGDVSNETIDFTIISDDANYSPLTLLPVDVTIRNNDQVTINISQTQVIVSETGGQDKVTITLGSMPSHDVNFTLDGIDAGEFKVNSKTFTIAPNDWNTGHEIIFDGLPDLLADGDTVTTVTITVNSDDNAWNLGLLPAPQEIQVTNIDNVPEGGFPDPCNLLSDDYTINYYNCALAQYKHFKVLPWRLGGSKIVTNIRGQTTGKASKTFIGEQKTSN